MQLRIDRFDQEVADQPDDEKPRQNIHRAVIDECARDPGLKLRIADVTDQKRSNHAGRRPRRQKPTMNGADELRTADVGEIGRNRREAATIHREDDAERRDEQRARAQMSETWRERVECDPKEEERVVSALPSDLVRQRGPEETAPDVEQ